MFFNPNTLFFLKPTPRSRWESFRTEGKETPVFDSVTGGEFPDREREPQIGGEEGPLLLLGEKLERKKLRAFWRNGRLLFGYWEMAAMPAPAAKATEQVRAVAEKEERWEGILVGVELGGFLGGWENKNGKRRDTMMMMVVAPLTLVLFSFFFSKDVVFPKLSRPVHANITIGILSDCVWTHTARNQYHINPNVIFMYVNMIRYCP